MSQDLKDQIRREAYITNEIVIKQEALRTKRDREDLSHRSNWENLMHKKLSGSELDLFIHGEHEAKNRKLRYKQETEDFLTSEGRSGSHNNLVMDDLETKV